jgi:hypothetical protein
MRKSQLVFHNDQRKVNDLIPYKRNPRKMSELQEAALRVSLDYYGLAEVPVIDTDNVICAGHQRLRILQALGEGESMVDVRVPDRKMTKREFEGYNLRSNQNRGEFNYRDLYENFEMDFLEEIGFDPDEIKAKANLELTENIPIDPDRMMIMTVLPPESPKLKEKTTIHFEDYAEYEKVKNAIESGDITARKILELL